MRMLPMAALLPALACAHGASAGGPTAQHGPGAVPTTTVVTGHAPVNGLRMYYELHGPEAGTPLVLLHGGGSTIEVTFGRLLPHLGRARRVLAVEEQGHGRSSGRDGPETFEASADDVAALLDHLKIAQADVLGFSNGANVALQLALRHPARVRKLIFASSITRRDGAVPQLWDWIGQADFSNMPQPLKDAFLKVNPDPAALRAMHDKDRDRMRAFTDVPDAQLRAITAPTLVLLGDRDIVRLDYAVELSRLIPGARLLILPGGHGDYLGEVVAAPGPSPMPTLTAGLVEAFLDGP